MSEMKKLPWTHFSPLSGMKIYIKVHTQNDMFVMKSMYHMFIMIYIQIVEMEYYSIREKISSHLLRQEIIQ